MKKPHPREIIGKKEKCKQTGICEPKQEGFYRVTLTCCKHCGRPMRKGR